MTATVRALNCAACGAGQSLPAAGRLKVHICVFCGATLDAADAFRPIGNSATQHWPSTPFEIGATGRIRGVEMTVIGVVGMVERYGGRVWRWVDHQLYSPTHGYAWLTWEEGRTILTRKQRVSPIPARVVQRTIAVAQARPSAEHQGVRYHYYDSGHEEIEFAAGSFNFTPQRGERVHCARYLGPEKMLTYRHVEGEMEWELSELLDRDATLESFGVDPASVAAPAPGVHPLEPFRRSPEMRELRNVALGFTLVAAMLALIAPTLFARPIAKSGPSPVAQQLVLPFTVTDPSRLVEVVLYSNVDNAWAGYELTVTTADGERTVAELERLVEYYHGYSDGYWSEGSTTTRVRFRPPGAGDYRITAVASELGVWRRGREPTTTSIIVREGVGSGWPLWMAAGAYLLVGLGLLGQRGWHVQRRWSGSDWSDE